MPNLFSKSVIYINHISLGQVYSSKLQILAQIPAKSINQFNIESERGKIKEVKTDSPQKC